MGAISSVVTFIVAVAYLGFYSKYTDSLHTDDMSGKLMGIFLYAWIFFSFLSIIFSFKAISSFILKRKFQGIGLAVLGILFTILVAGLVMPTLGLSHSVMYKRKANMIARKALNEFNQIGLDGNLLLEDYEIEIKDNYGKESYVVEVIYTLKGEFDFDSFPQHFSVILNLENGKAEILREDVLEE